MAEFDIINNYFNRRTNTISEKILVGIGDDCALLSIDSNNLMAVSTDTLVSGIHFFPNIDPSDLGYKSLAVNLSDLAAMGADPFWILLAITLPKIDESWIFYYSESLFKQLEYYNMQLIGGDITQGPLSLTVTISGLIPNGNALKRSGASIGDWIYVTGTLGDSAAGLAILQDRLYVNNEEDREYLLSKHLRPIPRVSEGIALRKLANATIDISDGIISDLSHILSSSNCGAIIYIDKIPQSPALKRQTTIYQSLYFSLIGGEDYELCFTVSDMNCNALKIAFKKIDVSLKCIGKILPISEGLKFIYNNKVVDLMDLKGYDHFK